jgi:basic membrane protein A
MSARRLALWTLLIVALAVVAAGCGGDDDDDAASATTTEATTTEEAPAGDGLRVGLVTDIGGLDDRSFNFLANMGLERAEEQLGVEGRVLISRAEADYVPNLRSVERLVL